MRIHTFFLSTLCIASVAHAAPDEDRLGKAQGYPIGTPASYFYDEAVRVGSFSNMDQVPFRAVTPAWLKAAPQPMVLPPSPDAASFASRMRWRVDGSVLTLDDYLARQRVMGLMVIKDGQVLVERYQYERTPAHRFLSNSMAKSIAALGFGMAVQEGLIASLDVSADSLEPALKGTLYGQATLRQLLRMSSGAQFSEIYDGKDDLARFSAEATARGIPAAAKLITTRAAEAGTVFKYSSAETAVLSQVFQAAVKQDLAQYLSTRLWAAIGAQTDAFWLKNSAGVVNAGGGFNATLADYARLGAVLANDGARPDTQTQVIPKAFLLEATDWKQQPKAFHPNVATPYFGYGYQFWTYPGNKRRFALLGVYGQYILVDPAQKLVMVQTSANETASAGKTTLGRESDAFWRGVVAHFGSWN